MVGAFCAHSADEWTAASGITSKIPPLYDVATSWFKYEELTDDWIDLAVLEESQRGPALKNRFDEGSQIAFRCQGRRRIHLDAAFERRFSQGSHGCLGDRIAFCFTSIHQRFRDSANEAHVDSEAEAEIFVICIVSIERRRLAHSSQILEQVCIQRVRHIRRSVKTP